MKPARVDLYKDRRGQHRWALVAGNGEVIASGEAHTQSSDAYRAWKTVERLVLLQDIEVRRHPGARPRRTR